MTAATQSPVSDGEGRGRNQRNVFYPILFGGLIFVLYALSLAGSIQQGESPCVPILFFLPVIPSIWGLTKLYRHNNIVFYRFYLIASASAMGGYCALWFSYCYFGRKWEFLSWVALGWIFWLVSLVIRMTQALIKRRDENGHQSGQEGAVAKTTVWNLTYLRSAVAEDPSWAIVLFFTVFVSLAYLFGFALGFYDQHALDISGGKKPALHMANVDSIDDPAAAAPAPVTEEAGKKSDSGTQPQLTPIISTPFHYHFTKGSARLKDLVVVTNPPQHPPLLTGDINCRPDVCNTVHMNAIIEAIDKATMHGNQVMILLVGHADNEPVDKLSPYQSNYELSNARAESIKYAIVSKLSEPNKNKWRNIEWLFLPTSNEQFPDIPQASEKGNSKTEAEEKNRVVLAYIKPISDHITALQMNQINFKKLKLMDYMYFSIYTITTTGYGDIVPTTAYAKFITSMANFCEVIFLVVFFNSLISLKGREPGGRNKNINQQQKDSPPGEPKVVLK